MVFQLCQRLRGFNHVITMNGYFTSPLLIKNLHSLDILARGTVCRKLKGSRFPHTLLSQTRVTRQGDCAVLLCNKTGCPPMLMHGKTVTWFVYPLLMIRQSHQRLSGSIGVRRWRFCFQLSSKSTTNAWVEWKDWPRSRTAYATASTRWWVYLFWYLFDIAVSNAFILMRDSQAHQRFTRSGKRKIVKFRRNLILDNV